MSSWIIPLVLLIILLTALKRGVPAFEVFAEGSKEGLQITLSLLPFLLGMMVAIGIFRASGAVELLLYILEPVFHLVGIPGEILPLALVRPISGTAALAVTTDLIGTHGPDSFIGTLASVMQGSTDTTLYILTVYFGAIQIKKYGNALKVGLLADFVGIIASIAVVTLLLN
ncbi:spore maturation protein [Salimicrobium halophilum]|uniref:Spore maturation protein B n=1 Tax=Salimicrobium halophilum TaxID=86666 RepID=A0A1G8PY39_9BACI|nr:spore maturation protein [Salimicrobium halophilum]SDI97391.1 spore maturation protein B [Salimicrobium halophilum]